MLLMLNGGHEAGESEESLATPFEQWCVSMDLHPEDSRAWPLYEARSEAGSHTPAAS